MQNQPKGAGENACKSIAAQDIADQLAVLTHVLALHPTHLRIPDLVRELTGGSADFAESDDMERAIRDLTGVGLLHCACGLVMPTPEALHFNLLICS